MDKREKESLLRDYGIKPVTLDDYETGGAIYAVRLFGKDGKWQKWRYYSPVHGFYSDEYLDNADFETVKARMEETAKREERVAEKFIH